MWEKETARVDFSMYPNDDDVEGADKYHGGTKDATASPSLIVSLFVMSVDYF